MVPIVQISMLSNKWLVRYLHKSEKQNSTLSVQDFDLQPYPGVGTPRSSQDVNAIPLR